MKDVPTWREKNLADSVAIYGRGRELFRPLTYNQKIYTYVLTIAKEK
jgi:hypothetical protein